MIGIAWLLIAGLGLGLCVGLRLGHIDYVAVGSRALHYQGAEGSCALGICILLLFLAIATCFALRLVILGGDHAQWVTGGARVLLVEVEERWNRRNAITDAGFRGQMLDAFEGAAQQTRHRDLLLAVGQLEQLVVLLP